jgi:hypothetical protein
MNDKLRLVGYLSFKNGQIAVNKLADQLMDRTNDIVKQHLDSYLSTPHIVNQINAEIRNAFSVSFLGGKL